MTLKQKWPIIENDPNFSFAHKLSTSVTAFAPKARRPTFDTRLSTPDYPSYISWVPFVFFNSLLLWLKTTVLWSGATSICDGFIIMGMMKIYAFIVETVLMSSNDDVTKIRTAQCPMMMIMMTMWWFLLRLLNFCVDDLWSMMICWLFLRRFQFLKKFLGLKMWSLLRPSQCPLLPTRPLSMPPTP